MQTGSCLGATENLLGGKYKVDTMDKHDNCQIFKSLEEAEEHLELMNEVRANITSQLEKREEDPKPKENVSQEERECRTSITSKLKRREEPNPKEKVREEEKEECGYCGKKYFRRGMINHKKKKHNEELKCNICNEVLQTQKTLENHYAKKHIVNTIAFLECTSCDYKTMNKYYMTDHIKRQHGNGNNDSFNSFICAKCFATKPNEYLLNKHRQQHVISVCVVCKKTFNSTKNLKRHIEIHEIQRCQECGKNFNSKKEFKLHKNSHKTKHTEVDVLA